LREKAAKLNGSFVRKDHSYRNIISVFEDFSVRNVRFFQRRRRKSFDFWAKDFLKEKKDDGKKEKFLLGRDIIIPIPIPNIPKNTCKVILEYYSFLYYYSLLLLIINNIEYNFSVFFPIREKNYLIFFHHIPYKFPFIFIFIFIFIKRNSDKTTCIILFLILIYFYIHYILFFSTLEKTISLSFYIILN